MEIAVVGGGLEIAEVGGVLEIAVVNRITLRDNSYETISPQVVVFLVSLIIQIHLVNLLVSSMATYLSAVSNMLDV